MIWSSVYKFLIVSVVCSLALTAKISPSYAAGSILESADELAKLIVEKALPDGKGTIAVSTITHSDNTCSDLSNFLSEQLVDSLFNANGGSFSIIERSQLNAIFKELNLIYDGTVAPDTAKKIGEIEGVNALVTAKITEFGDRIIVQGRLISTTNGKVFSTARSSFPRTGTISSMLKTRSRATCGFAVATGGNPARQTVSVTNTSSQIDAGNTYESSSFDAHISNIRLSSDGETINGSIRFVNKSKKPIGLSYISNTLHVTGDDGEDLKWKDKWKGLRTCGRSNGFQYCTDPNGPTTIMLKPGKILQHNFNVTRKSGKAVSNVSIGMELVVVPDVAKLGKWQVETVSFFDVPVRN
ncbi:FlgO family outer membrane protein [Coralliovum pocilloporae]|uniref:FlgO family outer membrane protein n=1 Tax=Coralliovum pocilloporae TaxID=3066369 RepID=UPI003306D6F5